MYEFDQTPCRPRSAEVGPRGPMGFAQAPSPVHLSPPLGLSGHSPHSGSLPDLTNLHFSNTNSALTNHVSGVASLDGSPESIYSDYHDSHDYPQGSPVRSAHDTSNGPGSRLVNPQVSPPRITVEVGSISIDPRSSFEKSTLPQVYYIYRTAPLRARRIQAIENSTMFYAEVM